jgi:hypothetical protein
MRAVAGHSMGVAWHISVLLRSAAVLHCVGPLQPPKWWAAAVWWTDRRPPDSALLIIHHTSTS